MAKRCTDARIQHTGKDRESRAIFVKDKGIVTLMNLRRRKAKMTSEMEDGANSEVASADFDPAI